MKILLALVLGTAFGFALNRVGATNPGLIINMLRLRDTHLMRVIFFAIGLSCLFLFSGLSLGLIDASHLSVKSAYTGVIVGGALLGVGFALAGYCPGTGLCAAATGRKDAWFFILGGLAGALAYMLVFGLIEQSWLFDKIAGGDAMLARSGNEKFTVLFQDLPGIVVAGVQAAAFMGIAWLLPRRIL